MPPVRGPRAFQSLKEHPWGMSTHAFPILFLPGFVGEFFGDDGLACSHNLMHEPTMQTLAMSGSCALVVA
jgi:hypothetical protein